MIATGLILGLIRVIYSQAAFFLIQYDRDQSYFGPNTGFLIPRYALIQYDRDLSSKLLYQWLERKGRPVHREVTDYTLAEVDQKGTVLDLYRKLSDVQSEATRVSFTLKFIQAQYGVAITSKQLFGWLKEKPKKGKK